MVKGGMVLLDVVVPVFGQPELLASCLKSLEETAPEVRYRLIVVDDASPCDMKSVYDGLDAEIVRNEKNLGFPATVNRGVKTGYAPLILLLNSDIVLFPGCIQAMLKEFEERSVGVVGAKLMFPPDSADRHRPAGKVQHAGMAFNIGGFPFHIRIGWDANHPKVNQRLDSLQCVTGALMMTRRFAWETAGGLSDVYGRGTFEDVEYCVRIKRMGYKVVYQPAAQAYHVVGASAGQAGYPLQQNLQMFLERNRGIIEWDEWRLW